MDKRYLNYADARARLNNSIVRWEGRPVLVRVSDRSCVGNYLRDLSGDSFGINFNDDRLDPSSVPLGFINQGGYTSYAARWPHRRYKAGVNEENTRVTAINGGRHNTGVLFSSQTADTIDGIYPSFGEVWDRVRTRSVNAMAFSRHLAMDDKKRIWCCTNKVGWVKDGHITLLKNFPDKMRQILEEMTQMDTRRLRV